jgi:hypothetical protein
VGYRLRFHETLNPDRVQSAAELGEDSGFCICVRRVSRRHCEGRSPTPLSVLQPPCGVLGDEGVVDGGLTKSQGRMMMPMLTSRLVWASKFTRNEGQKVLDLSVAGAHGTAVE